MICNLIVYENKSWILKRFADEIGECLIKLGFMINHSNQPDANCDLNIHFDHSMIDMGVIRDLDQTVHLIMITHVDKLKYLNKFVFLSQCAHVGFFTMSKWTKRYLRGFLFNNHKLIAINPPFNKNNPIDFTSYLTFGIFSNYYEDKRKNEYLLENLFMSVLDDHSSKRFKLIIYGRDWDKSKFPDYIARGFLIEIIDQDFDYTTYSELLKEIDYFIYTGHDEGSMSFLDAVFYRKRIIAIEQGFQFDMKQFIDFPFSSDSQFYEIIKKIMERHNQYIDYVKNSTWNNYVNQIVQLYEIIKENKELKYKNKIAKVLYYKLFSRKVVSILKGATTMRV